MKFDIDMLQKIQLTLRILDQITRRQLTVLEDFRG